MTRARQAAANITSVGVRKMKASTFCSLKVSHRLSKSACAHKASWTIITLMNRPCSRAMDSMEEMEEIGPKNLRPPGDQPYGARTAGSQCARGVGGAVAELVNGGLDSRTGWRRKRPASH